MESGKRVSPSPGREFRPRKPHKKSRFGCTKCKERRIKILDEVELELLEHYYEHTSVDATLDSGDMFALQIGIPNLALQSKPLMSSILAFTAACKCCDIINQPATSPEAYARVRELLLIADRYHGDSLREIQADIPGTKQYDHVLANAAMMTMYGTASHFIRTSLTRMAPADDPVPPELLPTQSRWMRLIRASSVAFSGIHDVTSQGISGKNPRDIATTLFSPGGAYSAPSSPGTFTSEPDSESFGQLSGVSSWLRRYLASATAEIPSRLPRRIIIAFIHRVPPDYLDYIEAALDHIPAQEDVYSEVLQHPGGSAWLGPSPRHQLAIDIFAHWLVLVLLLDDVWWIGNIGSWELRRVVSFWRSQAWSSSSAEGDQHWWPESMAEIDRQLRRHTRK
ncbi:hypothetical protein GQ53DRAFT_721609 [Thozetella sp. PMI_491]|nr:hypothetical protein GQ53DRAFT_721609 [Thozetella sp. PMI_491]